MMDKGKFSSPPLPGASSVSELHPSLAGGSSITSTKLNNNYIQWSVSITTFLLYCKKLHYIETVPPSNPDPTWLCEDAQVRSWLWNSMEPRISYDVILLRLLIGFANPLLIPLLLTRMLIAYLNYVMKSFGL